MLFSTAKEISHIIPTSRITQIDNLISRLNAEEMNSLYPLVGMKLLQKLRTDYEHFSQEEQGLWSCDKKDVEDETKVNIIRTAQEVLLYSYLANHNAILQTSINLGGGWNKASTNDYEALDSKDNDRLDKNLWHSSLRAKENLLLFLEQDARDQQIYMEEWKESEYYYLHSDLLFTTSSELHPNYINLGDTPHLTFQSYIATLHDCQDGYIAGTIGYPLLQALIDRKYIKPTTDESDTETPNIWRTLDRHIRTALANFTSYEHTGAKHDHLRNRGQSQLSIATRFIHEHYGTFSEYIPKGTPIYIPQKPAEEQNKERHKPKHQNKNHQHHNHNNGTVFSLLH